MRDALTLALSAVPGGYAEVRVRHRWTTTVVFRRRRPEVAAEADLLGGVARCLMPGHGWGAVAFNSLDRARVAVERARELSLQLKPETPIRLAPIPIRQIERADPLTDDPRAVPLGEKRGFLERITGELLEADHRIVDSRTTYTDSVHETWLATTDGTWLHDLRAEAALGALAVASEDGATERAVDSVALAGGWNAISARGDLVPSAAERAVLRLHARPVRPGRYTAVFDPRATGALTLQTIVDHCRAATRGHDRELLALGTRVGPECLSIGDDPTASGLRTSLTLDDEGTPASNTPLVRHGVVVGHLHTRETAGRDHASPTGHALAPAVRSIPGARPTNAYLAKGRADPDRFVAETGEGLYLSDIQIVGSEESYVSIVPGFARMIRRGQLAEPVKCPAITGDLYSLLRRLDAVAGDFTWDASASQLHEGAISGRSVTTGAPHTRFVDIEVGPMYA